MFHDLKDNMVWLLAMSSIPILFQDEHKIIVEKPSGLLVHRSSKSSDKRFLLQELRNQLGQHLYPVHRLDRGVSGVMVFGLSSEAVPSLQDSLTRGSKDYLALVMGRVDSPFRVDRELTNEQGLAQPALSEVEPLEVYSKTSLVRVRITTGRHHQIRRHLSSEAHAILGDTTHGKGRINAFFREELGLNRIFLHAWKLRLGEQEWESSLPQGLEDVLMRLRHLEQNQKSDEQARCVPLLP